MEQGTTLNRSEINSKPNVRQSNIELLRIFCMLMIIGHHFCVHSGFEFAKDYFGFNRFLVDFFFTGGDVAVNCFILITGYFSISSIGVKAIKPFRQWLEAFFYSIVIFIIFTVTGVKEFTWPSLLENLFVVIFERWWFFSAYFVLLIFSPALNILLRNIPKKGYKLFILISLVFYSLIPTLVWTTNFFTSNWEINEIIWFIILYSIGGYFKLYGNPFKMKTRWFFIFSGLLYLLIYGSIIGCNFIGVNNDFFLENAYYLGNTQTLPTLLLSVLFFLGFTKLNIKENKVINFVSGLVFGIYLVHDHPFVREILWKSWIPSASKYMDSPYLILIAFGAIFGVFIMASVVEIIRKYCIEKIYIKPLNKLCLKIDNWIMNLFTKSNVE